MISKMYKVEFFSLSANKHVTKSKHKTLSKAVEKARKAYLDHPCDISIVCPDGTRLNRYGGSCYYCEDSICEGRNCNHCQVCVNPDNCTGTDCHLN